MDSEVGTNILKEYTATIFTQVQAEAVCISDMPVHPPLDNTCYTAHKVHAYHNCVNLALKLGQSQRQGTNRVASVKKSTD